VAIVGDFDVAQTVQMVNQYFARVPKAERPVPRDIPKEPAQTKEKRAVVTESWPLPAVVVGYHVTYDGHPDAYPLHMTAKILSDGNSARIPRELMYNKRLALTAFGSGNITEDPNLFYAVAVLQPGRTAAEAEKALIEEFEKLKREPVSAVELQRAKNQWARDYIIAARRFRKRRCTWRTPPSFTTTSARPMASSRFSPTSPARTFSGWRRPTSTRTIASSSTSCRRRAVRDETLGLGIWDLGFGIWDLWCGRFRPFSSDHRWPIERMPRPLPAREVTFPPYDIRTLPNGMQVITVLQHEQPAVTMRLLVRAGGANDPDKKRGVSYLVSNLLDQGTTTRSSQQIADQIDTIGGALSTGSGDDFTSISANRDEGFVRAGDGPGGRQSPGIRRSRRTRSSVRKSRSPRRSR
jgi:zinc protease